MGLRANLYQVVLQVLLVFFVGMTVGLERNVVPILGKEVFGVTSFSVLFSFILSFGIVKALMNLFSGVWADRWGQKTFSYRMDCSNTCPIDYPMGVELGLGDLCECLSGY